MPTSAIGITVREAMKLGPLREAIVLGGSAGLDRIVTTVNVMETDDAPRLLTGNELLITALYAVRDDVNAQLRWLDELAQRGCAGVILCYIGRYFKGDIEALVRRADELALPLLTIPGEKVLYSDIMTTVLVELLQRQTKRLEYALSVHNRLTQEVLMGASLETLIRSLSELLESTVIVTDADLEVAVASPFGSRGHALLQNLLSNGDWRAEVRSPGLDLDSKVLLERLKAMTARRGAAGHDWFDTSMHPIQVERTLAGYLLVFKYGKVIEEIQDYALQVGVTVIALERMRALRVRETERRLQGDFLDDVLHWSIKSPDIVASRALSLGLDLQDKRVVIVVSIDDRVGAEPDDPTRHNTDEEVYRLVEGVIRRQSSRSVVVPRGSRLLVLFGVDSDHLSSTSIKEQTVVLGQLILKEFETSRTHSLQRYGHLNGDSSGTGSGRLLADIDLSIGIGSASRNFSGLHQSYADALQAIEVGRRLFGPGHVMHIDDLSLYAILDFVSERKEARQMVEDVLGPLKAYDVANGTDLLKTLEMICLSGEGGGEVARKLYVHRNTLAYRQTRIKELLGFDPFSGQGRIRVDVALMLDKLMEADRESGYIGPTVCSAPSHGR